MTRQLVVHDVGEFDVERLADTLPNAIAYLQGQPQTWSLSVEHEYDGYLLTFIEVRLENDTEYAERQSRDRAWAREQQRVKTNLRAAKQKDLRAQIEKLRKDLEAL